MLKKYSALLMMSLAWVILFGHSIVPHHHHDVNHNHDASEHHHGFDHQHDNEDSDSKGLNHLFSHLTHSADGFQFTTSHNLTNTFSKQQLSVVSILPGNIFIVHFIIPDLQEKLPASNFIYISPHSQSACLRAPPIFTL